MNAEAFVKTLIIGFGAIEGFWINAGVNPTKEIINALTNISSEYMSFGWAYFALALIPIAQIISVYILGGLVGLLALLLAFLGGVFITTTVGIFILFISIPIGFWAFSMERKITFCDALKFIVDVVDYIKSFF